LTKKGEILLKTKDMILTALFAAVTAVGAFIKIPLPFVPITLQGIFVTMAGLVLGSRLGALSQLLYLFIGLVGIPIFTEGGGPTYVFKPTFGFLVGFAVAAFVIGRFTENRQHSYFLYISAAFIGLFIVYAFGAPYLYFVLKNVAGVAITPLGALKAGVLPFIPGDILKNAIAVYIAVEIKKRIK
jgi:biotin transport system substrate-specific component